MDAPATHRPAVPEVGTDEHTRLLALDIFSAVSASLSDEDDVEDDEPADEPVDEPEDEPAPVHKHHNHTHAEADENENGIPDKKENEFWATIEKDIHDFFHHPATTETAAIEAAAFENEFGYD